MFIAYTICTENYLPYAKALGISFIKFNPKYRFIIFVFNIKKSLPQEKSSYYELIDIESLSLPYYYEMKARYNDFELSCALKPFVAEYLLSNILEGALLFYLDSDMLVFGPFAKAEKTLSNNSILLSPHITKSFNDETGNPKEETILKAGVYNAGFWGISKCIESFRFIKWWQEKLRIKCFSKIEEGLFVDQIWLSYVPIFFEKTIIFKDPGYNVAYWNLNEREIKEINNCFMVNDNNPLILFHYSGYNIFHPEEISKYQNRFSFIDMPYLKFIFDIYVDTVIQNDIEKILKDNKLPPIEEKNVSSKWHERIFSFFKK
jgi:hypothetical protein